MKDKEFLRNCKHGDYLKSMELPDRSKVDIDIDRLRVPEAMFNTKNY